VTVQSRSPQTYHLPDIAMKSNFIRQNTLIFYNVNYKISLKTYTPSVYVTKWNRRV